METLKFLMTSSFYPPYHVGGDAMHVKYLAEELAKRGHEVHVLHSLDAYRIKRKNMPKSEQSAVNTHVVETCYNSSAYAAYLFGCSTPVSKKFHSLIKEINPDVVHHHNISLLGYDLLRKRGNYLNLYTAHDYWLICQRNNLLKPKFEICDGTSCFFCALETGKPPQIWRRLKRFKIAVESIDYLIAPSNYIRNRLLKIFNVKSIILPNFVPEPPNKIEPSNFKDFFLYAGVLERHKGILELINIYKKLDYIQTKLLILGDGSLKERILALIKKSSLENKVMVLGHMNKDMLYPLLRDAKALLVPSIVPENCPLIILEAMSVGTPVIASNNGGLPEIVERIDSKLIYNTNAELRRLLTGFNREEYSAKTIQNTYKKYYSKVLFIEKYSKLLEKIN